MNALTAERLRELLDYQPREGLFYWRVDRYSIPGTRLNVRAGDVAGSVAPSGYRFIGIDGCRYLASRLAWLWMTGDWPDGEVDHRDTNSANDRWENLRETTRGLNNANTKRRSDNTSGFKGVSFDAPRRKWAAQISVDRRRIFLGRFHTAQSAYAAYVAAAEKHFGEYARIN
jgi:hypothetical protein